MYLSDFFNFPYINIHHKHVKVKRNNSYTLKIIADDILFDTFLMNAIL